VDNSGTLQFQETSVSATQCDLRRRPAAPCGRQPIRRPSRIAARVKTLHRANPGQLGAEELQQRCILVNPFGAFRAWDGGQRSHHTLNPRAAYNKSSGSAMRESDKEKVEAAAVTSVGAGVGTAGGATVGVLELAATTGTVTALSAGVVIGLGALAGAATFFLGYKAYRRLKGPKS